MTPQEQREWFPQPPTTLAEHIQDRYNYWVRFRLWSWWGGREQRREDARQARRDFWYEIISFIPKDKD